LVTFTLALTLPLGDIVAELSCRLEKLNVV
jgi:hypothetical protein